MTRPLAPAHLRQATRRWFAHVARDFALEQHHFRLLALAGEAWDRAETAREALDANGLTFVDKSGAPRARPEIAIERDARTDFAKLLRGLGLGAEMTPR